MNLRGKKRQAGVSLSGLIFVLGVLGLLALLGMQVVPTFLEYRGISKAIVYAKSAGSTVREIQGAFDRQANVGYLESISGKDLVIVKNNEEWEVSFAYQKIIPLFGPASLLLDYTGTTARTPAANASTKRLPE